MRSWRSISPTSSKRLNWEGEAVNLREAAEVLGCGKSKVLSLLREGELRGIKGIGRGYKIKKGDLQRYIEEL